MTVDALTKLTKAELEAFFFEHARYMEDAPSQCYFIRLGSRALHSADTLELRRQFEKAVYTRKRALARWGK